MSSNNKQVALLIGGSRGIGHQIAIDLARHGYYRMFYTANKMSKTLEESNI